MTGGVVQVSEKYRIVCSVLRGGSGITGSVDTSYQLRMATRIVRYGPVGQ